MIEVHGAKTGLCIFCTGKAKKQKEVVVVKGDYKGEVCPAHLLVLAQQQNGKHAD